MSKGAKQRASDRRKAEKRARKLSNYLRNGPKQGQVSKKKQRIIGWRKAPGNPALRASSIKGKNKSRRRKGMRWI